MRRAAAAALALAALSGLPAPSFADEVRAPGTISVVGRARSETPPDFASVEIGVESRGATPAAALDATSEAARRIVALAGEFKLGEGDVGTTAVTLQPVTRTVEQPDGSEAEKPDGYRASNQVRLRLSDMGRLGELMRRALDAGANRIESVSFGLKDPEAVEAALRIAALKDAMAQAARLAETAGTRLGRVVSIQSPPPREAAASTMPFPMPMRAKARGATPVPLVAGSIEASAEVAASFAVEK